MILAVATVKKHIAPHYAFTENFDLYKIIGQEAKFMYAIPYSTNAHLESFDQLKEAGVDAVVMDMVGEETFEHLEGRGLSIYYGQKGMVKSFLLDFLDGKIKEPKVYVEDTAVCSL